MFLFGHLIDAYFYASDPLSLVILFLSGPVLVVCLLPQFSLVLPAIAADRWLTPVDSWNLTRPYRGKMIVIDVVFPMLLATPPALLFFAFEGVVGQMFASLVSAIVTVFTITALSLAYREIVEKAPPSD